MTKQQHKDKVELLHERDLSSWYLKDLFCYFSTVFGALLRLWCYKSLDEFFTFNVGIQKNHKLITTGPYSLLMHPSYTAYVLMLTNIIYMLFVISDFLPNYIVLIFNYVIALVMPAATVMAAIKRMAVEERCLKQHFGKDWVIYCSQKKKLIPYLL